MSGFRKPGAADPGRLIVCIEGDGTGWHSRTRRSENPTPLEPIALRLALRDARPGLLYLAWPCQYVARAVLERCDPALWSGARYSEQVVAATYHAINATKRAAADKVILMGYSGGGVLAALLAAQHADVEK